MKKTVKFALKQSLPIFFGYIFLGFAFGILLQQVGYNSIWAFFTSLTVYAGAMQFVLVDFLIEGTPLITVAIMTLLINFRHVFYGLSFIEKFKTMGKKYPYMIFSLTDETYSVLCSCKYPDGIDEKQASFLIALFNQCYWILGGVLGAAIGQLVPFSFKGIDFSMTALFVVLLIEQWKSCKNHLPAIIGLITAAISLIIFGANNFILPALIVTVAILMAFNKSPLFKVEEDLR